MSSLQALREFVSERLTAAAGEIFTAFEQTIVQYEEEISRQHRMLEIFWKPQIKLHRTELLQHRDCREELLFKQETNYCLEQDEPEPPQIKKEQEEPGLLQFRVDQEGPEPSQIEEHEELGTSRDRGQLTLKVESDSLGVPPIEEQRDLHEPEDEPHTEQVLAEEPEPPQIREEEEEEEEPGLLLFKNHEEEPPCQNLRTATDEKKIYCEICGKSYNRRHTLSIHKRIHTGEKPYSCETCGRSFSRRDYLLVHKRTHSGEKPYSCETCGKGFTQHGTLIRHARTHTGETPYSCEKCGTRFSHLSSLQHHMKCHHPV